MLAVPLAVRHPRELQVIAARDTHDFGERDRLVLGLLAPHFSAGVAHAETIGRLQAELAALRHGLEADGRAVILLGPGRRVGQISERAQDWLVAYFGARRADRTALPPTLDAWLRRQELGAAGHGALAVPRRPLVAERDGRRLTVRALSADGGMLLLLSERKLRIAGEDLASLGLSPRETEVLAWLAGGKTNRAIAGILGLSPLTIKHCVERIYTKLNVRTRAAATARAVAAAGVRD
jgi:DNA-binding CsgD family transcriptional regulator